MKLGTVLWLSVLTVLWWASFQYVLKTRPRIDFLPDNPKCVTMRSDDTMSCAAYPVDGNGFPYIRIRIFHESMWSNFPHDVRLPFFEPDAHQAHNEILRLTDMGSFLTNHGFRGMTEYGEVKQQWLQGEDADYTPQPFPADVP